MNKVTIIHLNGRAYHIEESGYEALRRYLDEAKAKLENDPDKDEIMKDFEQAIADKCERYLGKNKDVVTAEEIDEIIKAMGPVAGTANDAAGAGSHAHGAASGTGTSSGATPPKRLYQVHEGAWFAGVCNGLAAYFGFDVTLVRVLFIIFGFITHGGLLLVYLVLMIVMPVAHTNEERAEAYGMPPFNAHDFIEESKKYYAEYQKTGDTRAWKQNMRQWKRDMKNRWRNEWRANYRDSMHYGWNNGAARVARFGLGVFSVILGLALAALCIALVAALWSFVATGVVFGYAIGAGYPTWVSIVFLISLFYVAATPIRLLLRHVQADAWGVPNRYHFFKDFIESIFFIAAIIFLFWTAQELFPIVREALGVVHSYLVSIKK